MKVLISAESRSTSRPYMEAFPEEIGIMPFSMLIVVVLLENARAGQCECESDRAGEERVSEWK